MKLRQPETLPPEAIRLTGPGLMMQKLKAYQQYQYETAHLTWELKDLTLEILRAFLDEGDRRFLVWQKQQRNGHDQTQKKVSASSVDAQSPTEIRQG